MKGGFYVTADDITSKTQFVAALHVFLSTGKTTTPYEHGEYKPSRGELVLVAAIADFLEAHTEIPDKELGINWFHDLAPHLVDAFVEFRIHPKHSTLRQIYREHTDNEEIPDLLDMRGRYVWQRVTRDLVKLMPLVAGRCGGEWLAHELEAYFEGERRVIYHAWRRFLRVCYRPIALRLKTEGNTAKGVFGRTMLNVDSGIGRIQFQFARTSKLPDVELLDRITNLIEVSDAVAENKLAALEALLMTRKSPIVGRVVDDVTFIGDESDLYGCRSGLNFPSVRYQIAVEMINDVVDNWDPNGLR